MKTDKGKAFKLVNAFFLPILTNFEKHNNAGMGFVTTLLIAIVALEHIYFLVLEMFLWTKPKGIKAFGLKSKQFAEDTKVLAANQGLYNGFLAAGLLFSIFENDFKIAAFFLFCVTIAGIYGSYSTKQIKLFCIQAVPAMLALASFLL